MVGVSLGFLFFLVYDGVVFLGEWGVVYCLIRLPFIFFRFQGESGHPLNQNASSAIYVTEFGIVTDVSGLPINARHSIDFTEFGIVTDVSLLFLNAPFPIDVTEFGMVIDLRSLSANAPHLIVCIPYPSVAVLILSIANAFSWMFFIDHGIIT